MKVALVGCAPTWRDAPFTDPSWAIWAHTSGQSLHLPRVDRWFDIHDVATWRQGKRWYRPQGDEPATYVEWLRTRPQPIVMQAHYPLIPTSERLPLREMVAAFGIVPPDWAVTEAQWWELVKDRGEFTATACYMLALALYEGATEIGLFGIDFIGCSPDDQERTYQRPGMKYWVGVARGMGVPVTVAKDSWLEFNPRLYGYGQPVLQEA